MTFQDLKSDYQRQLDDPSFRAENKQRLNLSSRAYTIILNDSVVFRDTSPSKQERNALPSHVINHIFRCFRETAQASAALTLHNRRMELENLLASVQPNTAGENLVGMKASCKEDPWMPGAIRVTSIKDGKYLKQTAFICKEEKKAIEIAIRKNGVQYLSDSRSSENIKVQFTPEGERMYHRLLHLRPMYTANPEPLIYEFHCTMFQAEAYFFKYGHNVKILEPKSLFCDGISQQLTDIKKRTPSVNHS